MSGSLKELHCPYHNLVSRILNGGELKATDHLKLVCRSPVDRLLSTSLCRRTRRLKRPLFCLVSSVPQLGAPGSSDREEQTRDGESAQRRADVSGAPVHLRYSGHPGAQRGGHGRTFLPNPRQGGTDVQNPDCSCRSFKKAPAITPCDVGVMS